MLRFFFSKFYKKQQINLVFDLTGNVKDGWLNEDGAALHIYQYQLMLCYYNYVVI